MCRITEPLVFGLGWDLIMEVYLSLLQETSLLMSTKAYTIGTVSCTLFWKMETGQTTEEGCSKKFGF
jgi:hypothetical protein